MQINSDGQNQHWSDQLHILVCIRVCLCASVCVFDLLIHQVCGWVLLPIHYWAAGINSKCSLTDNFPSVSLRHKVEQVLLVSGQ